ncbi:MAG: hypothetical protein IT196_11725 [Acidimicrobiales bacterium]|nr:hypothetical protein [Acidimicrobiales bacterium]
MVRQHRLTRSLLLAVGVSAAAAGLVACGDPVDTASITRVGGERFEEIRFEELYRPPTATSKTKEKVDLVQTETLTIEKSDPEQVVKTYGKVLTEEGWSEVQEPTEKRDKSWYGAWTKMGRNIVVTAEFGTAVEEGAALPTDFTLAFQRPTKTDQITGVGNDPITG